MLQENAEVTQLCLSADQCVLAAVVQNSVIFYSIPDLAAGKTQPLQQQTVDGFISQFTWSKDGRHLNEYVIVTGDRVLMHAAYPVQPVGVAEDVLAADWAPQGTCVAYSR